MELAPSAAITASVGLLAPNGSVGRQAGFAYAPEQVYWIGAPLSDAALGPHIELHRFAALKRAAVGSQVSLLILGMG